MDIQFIKMQGVGNDYVYMDLLARDLEFDFQDLARKISSRHFGVGGDGLVLIMESKKADFRMRMFNADGSEAEMCGNAVRCVGKYLYDSRYIKKEEFSIETLGGIKHLWITGKAKDGEVESLRVDMGSPILRGSDIPIAVDREPVTGVEVMGYTGTAVSMGNPHFIIFVNEITDRQVLGDGPKLEVHPLFPKKANIEFVQVVDKKNMVMRVWERGSGETLACGTGACAAAVAGVLNERIEREVDIKLLGGILHIEWNEQENHVYMSGPAEEVFRGVYRYLP